MNININYYKELGEVTVWNKRFNNIGNKYTSNTISTKNVSAAVMKSLENSGDIKLLSVGLFDGYTDCQDTSIINELEVIAIPSGGTANIKYYNGKFINSGNLLAISSNTELYNLKYIYYYLQKHVNLIEDAFRGVSIKHPQMKDILGIKIPICNIDMQNKIASILSEIDNKINSEDMFINKLKETKKSLLELLFPSNNSNHPQLRFKDFTSPWEQRKFSELVQIERGGSPRPIDNFITDAPNGLNWVKIGDAPTQGNCITKTAEKIRPEGLSKTREVHPGDLILSNSMSFGKPYIMGIDGCIHDGWLLIRNAHGVFDLTFLCHLLGAPQMLNQYKSLAAGSTVNNLNKELVGDTYVTIPSITEQRVLGTCLEHLNHLITLHQCKLKKYKEIKSALLDKLLV